MPARTVAVLVACFAFVVVAGEPAASTFTPLDPASASPAMRSGVVVSAVLPGTLGERSGFRVGDLVLGVDNLRLHDERDVQLFIGQRRPAVDAEVWLVVRGGAVKRIAVSGMLLVTRIGIQLDPLPAERDPPPGAVFAQVGVAVDAAARAELDLMPYRVCHLIAEYHAATPGVAVATWAGVLADTWLAALRGTVLPPPVAIPVPALAQLDAFWRAVAVRGDAGDPDVVALNVTPGLAALAWPYPAAPPLAFGRPVLADAALATFLAKPPPRDRNYQQACEQTIAQLIDGVELTDDYLRFVKMSLVDPINHGGWPHRSDYVRDASKRAVIKSELRNRLAAGGADSSAVRYALVAPTVIDDDRAGTDVLLKALLTESPMLAWRALDMARRAARMHQRHALARSLDDLAQGGELQRLPRGSRIYAFCQRSNPDFERYSMGLDFGRDRGLPALARGSPVAVASALAGDSAYQEAWRQEWTNRDIASTNLSYALSLDVAVADGEQCLALAEQIQFLAPPKPERCNGFVLAACYARAGDFARAVAWQEVYIEWLGKSQDQVRLANERLAQYRRGEPVTQPQGLVFTPFTENGPDGKLRVRGTMAQNLCYGRWSMLHDNGQVAAEGMVRSDVPIGRWRDFDRDGRVLSEGWYWIGLGSRRMGISRIFHPNGRPAIVGWSHDEKLSEARWTGPWESFGADGVLLERGTWMHGVRHGIWQVGPDHRPSAIVRFDAQGKPDRSFPGSDAQPVPDPAATFRTWVVATRAREQADALRGQPRATPGPGKPPVVIPPPRTPPPGANDF